MANVAVITSDRLGDHPTRGSERLVAWLKKNRWSRARLARQVMCGAATIDRLVHGDRLPEMHVALALQTECEIPLAAWGQPPTARFVKTLRKAAKAA